MLINFEVENFLSFNEKKSFSMKANKGTRLNEHLIDLNRYKITKNAFVFGANASGKSNFIKCFSFLKQIILNKFDGAIIDKKFFRLNPECSNKDAYFSLTIKTNDKTYKYELSFSYSKKIITYEKLTWLATKDVVIFERSLNNGVIEILTGFKFKSKDEDLMFFESFIKSYNNIDNLKMYKTLFLSDMCNRSPKESDYFSHYINVINWFHKLIILFPSSEYGNFNKLLESEKKEDFVKTLECFDTGVINVKPVSLDFDEVISKVDKNDSEELKEEILNHLEKGPVTLRMNTLLVTMKKENENIKVTQLLLDHGSEDYLFDLTDESDGTRRLFDLIPLYFIINYDCVILIDEIDRSLHTKLVREFLKIFFERNKESKSQLIVTSHDVNLLDLEFIRQDEIWFISRESGKGSSLLPLKDKSLRFDKRLIRDYIDGEFGGVPNFKY